MLFFTDDVSLVEFMYLVFIHMPAKSYCRWSMVCVAVYDIFRAPINSFVHSICTTMWSVHKEMLISQMTHPQSQCGNKTQSTQPHRQSRASTHAGFIFIVTIASLSPSSHCHHHHTVAIATLSPSLLHCHHCHTVTIATTLSPLRQPCTWKHSLTLLRNLRVQHASSACSPPFSTFWWSIFLSPAKVSCTLSAFLQYRFWKP